MRTGIAIALAAASLGAQAQSHMRNGYVTKNGTYVAPSYATHPNSTKLDNYRTVGNVNPYSGRVGTVDPYRAEPLRAPTYRPSTVQPSTLMPYRFDANN